MPSFDREEAFRLHIDSDLSSITLEQLLQDSPRRLARPHILFWHIHNIALALGFRHNSPQSNRLFGEASARAVEKYWRVLWTEHSFANAFPGLVDRTVRGLCALLCFWYNQYVQDAPNDSIGRMRLALYNHRQFSRNLQLNGETCDVVCIAVQYMRHGHGFPVDYLHRIMAEHVRSHPDVAELLLTKASRTREELQRLLSTVVGERGLDLPFLRRVAKVNLNLIPLVPDLNSDPQYLISLMPGNNRSLCEKVVSLADAKVRMDGTFICDIIERCPGLYHTELNLIEKNNPLYAVNYLRSSNAGFNWVYTLSDSKTLRGSFPFARMLFNECGDILSNGPYNIYEYFDERIREKLEIAVLAFKACNGHKAQRTNMCYALHLTLYGNNHFLKLAKIKDPEQAMRNAVLDRVRRFGERKNRRPKTGHVQGYEKNEGEARRGFTHIEQKWLRKTNPALFAEAVALYQEELLHDPDALASMPGINI